ncbi:unnamed protein product [Boreogadus saida]
MNIPIVLLILLGVHLSKEQQTTERFGEILLRLDFPMYFDSFDKSCCRMLQAGCFIAMDNRGYVCNLLRGRATLTERSGSVEFRITNAQLIDGGHYRCYVEGIHNVFKDFVVEVSEPSKLRPHSLVSTLQPSSTITTPPTPATGSRPPPYRKRSPIAPWTLYVLLATSLSITTIALIGCVTAVVCCLRKKSKNQVVESQPDSSKHMTPEASSIVYTTVDFKHHQLTPIQLYANLEMRALTTKQSKDLRRSPETVEYCTLAPRR